VLNRKRYGHVAEQFLLGPRGGWFRQDLGGMPRLEFRMPFNSTDCLAIRRAGQTNCKAPVTLSIAGCFAALHLLAWLQAETPNKRFLR